MRPSCLEEAAPRSVLASGASLGGFVFLPSFLRPSAWRGASAAAAASQAARDLGYQLRLPLLDALVAIAFRLKALAMILVPSSATWPSFTEEFNPTALLSANVRSRAV